MRLSSLFRTSTFRLAVFFALAVTASANVVYLFIYWQVASFNVNRLDNILTREIARAVSQPDDQLKREIDLRFASDLRHLDYAALFDQSGRRLYGNVSMIPKGLVVDGVAHTVELRSQRGPYPGRDTAVVVASRRPDNGIVILGRSVYEIHALTGAVIQAITMAIVPAILLALGAGVIFSLRGMRRLKAIHETTVRIMHGDLQERLPASGKMDDLNYVASAVNLMLDEIVRLLNQIKSVGDNIAHDLRAPLVVMRAKLERGLMSPSELNLSIAAEGSLVDLDRALATISALLRISEIEFERRHSGFACVNLTDVCKNVFELYEPLAEAKKIAFTFDGSDPLPVIGDFDLLVEAVANIVDNAIEFTPKGGSVNVSTKTNSSGFFVCVSDNGPGIAPDERDKVFKRFYRSQKSRQIPGMGLGLNMAATIVDVHGFDLRIEDNHPGAAFIISPHALA